MVRVVEIFSAGGVAHVLAVDHEDDHLGQVGSVVGHPFQIIGDRLEARCPVHVMRAFHHGGEQLVEDLRVERVNDLVAVDDLARALGILGHEGVRSMD